MGTLKYHSEKKQFVVRACVVSRVLYSLKVHCLTKVELARLDAFYVGCLRKIWGIPHSMLSRVSNHSVLRTARQAPLSKSFLQQQLCLFGRLAGLPAASTLRKQVFCDFSAEPLPLASPRRRGRPKMSWMKSVHAHALAVAGGTQESLSAMVCDDSSRRTSQDAVARYCFN